MRWVTYRSATGPRLAGVGAEGYVDLQSADPGLPDNLKDLLAAGPEAQLAAAAAIQRGRPLAAGALALLPPIPNPQKVICVGLNYADHARETGQTPPSEPVIFNKFPTALAGHEQTIVLPRLSQQVDYEAELVVVIGRGGRHIPAADALAHVAGYCCGHDVSARDWQLRKPGGQWLLGKSFDGFAPCGPELVTADEVGETSNLRIQCRINGETMQDSTTGQLIFPVAELVAYISGICTLMPGDLIYTGTPPGVGVARKPQVFLKPGDVVEVEIERVGLLRNTFAAENSGL